MLLGRVMGTLVATRKEPSMEGLKFLVLKQLDIEGQETGGYRVAADAVGAGWEKWCCMPPAVQRDRPSALMSDHATA